MKKSNFRSFLAGVLTTALVSGLVTTALAVSGAVSFNLSPIAFNGEIISAAGEGYTLSNGCVAPASITYTDEQGGGTTYLPARRVSELLDVDIGWDPATGAVTIGKVEQPTTPDTTTAVSDYSDWSAEDEAAYQEFKELWEDIGTATNPKLVADIDMVRAYAAKTPKDKAYSYIKRLTEEYSASAGEFVGLTFWDKRNTDGLNNALLGGSGDTEAVKLVFDTIWDDVPFALGTPMLNLQL